jgi:hypothetical protein
VPDWRRIVDEHLGAIHRNSRVRREVATELASHLEEVYEERRAQGVAEMAAFHCALAHVEDWHALAGRIARAKAEEGEMNHRTKSVWVPGLISLTLASVALAGVQRFGLAPHIVWLRSGLAFMLYIPWLIALPFVGALGAYASRRAGGRIMDRVASGLFPAFGVICALCVAAIFAIFVDRRVNSHVMAFGMAMFLLNWIVLPAAALFIGTLPFLRGTTIKQAEIATASDAAN